MNLRKIKNISFFSSVAVHILVLLILYVVSFPVNTEETDYVLMGFGSFGKGSSINRIIKSKKAVKQKSKVSLPKVKNVKKSDVAIPKKKEKKKKKPEEETTNTNEGNYGFKIDFGGKGIRKIYSYELPSYPPGVHKEIDVKLRFSILPDGTVANIIPLIKADTQLEMAAINSLKMWRFEPIPKGKKKTVQWVTIVFPYRLK